MRTILAATGVAVAATIVGVGAYAAQSSTLDVTSPAASTGTAVGDNPDMSGRDQGVGAGGDGDGVSGGRDDDSHHDWDDDRDDDEGDHDEGDHDDRDDDDRDHDDWDD
jgi:hypothetical protein